MYLILIAITGAVAVTAAPCDIYGAGGTPCVAAHSVVRALYDGYFGALYQVTRTTDNAVVDVGVLDGYADIGVQSDLCEGEGSCVVTKIYDQSPMGNHLDTAPAGGAAPQPDDGVDATRRPTMVGGRSLYGAYFDGGKG